MKLNIARELNALEQMTVGELQERYVEVFREPVRSRHRQYLIRRIAWRLQANAEGGLTERALRRAEELAADVGGRPVTAARDHLAWQCGAAHQPHLSEAFEIASLSGFVGFTKAATSPRALWAPVIRTPQHRQPRNSGMGSRTEIINRKRRASVTCRCGEVPRTSERREPVSLTRINPRTLVETPGHTTPTPRLVSLKTLAKHLDAHRSSVRRWLEEAGVRPVVLGRGRNGAIRYLWSDVERWLESLERVS